MRRTVTRRGPGGPRIAGWRRRESNPRETSSAVTSLSVLTALDRFSNRRSLSSVQRDLGAEAGAVAKADQRFRLAALRVTLVGRLHREGDCPTPERDWEGAELRRPTAAFRRARDPRRSIRTEGRQQAVTGEDHRNGDPRGSAGQSLASRALGRQSDLDAARRSRVALFRQADGRPTHHIEGSGCDYRSWIWCPSSAKVTSSSASEFSSRPFQMYSTFPIRTAC